MSHYKNPLYSMKCFITKFQYILPIKLHMSSPYAIELCPWGTHTYIPSDAVHKHSTNKVLAHTLAHTQTHINTHTNICAYTPIQEQVRTYKHIHIHKHIHTHSHT